MYGMDECGIALSKGREANVPQPPLKETPDMTSETLQQLPVVTSVRGGSRIPERRGHAQAERQNDIHDPLN